MALKLDIFRKKFSKNDSYYETDWNKSKELKSIIKVSHPLKNSSVAEIAFTFSEFLDSSDFFIFFVLTGNY